MRIKHISIVGVGLIGGSFALAARRARLAERITGWGSERSLEAAIARGVIDDIEHAFESGQMSNADLVYLAAPVGAIIKFLRTRGQSIKPGAIVTDAGSTKREICRAAREGLPRAVRFVGGHPMAGNHKTGVEFAAADLFEGAAYAIVPDERDQNTDTSTGAATEDIALTEEIALMVDIAKAIGARPVILEAKRHDYIVARVSHVPQLLSTALGFAAAKRGDESLALAGNGFFEMARLAESQWSVWEDICRTNADEISDALDEVTDQIKAWRDALDTKKLSTLRDAFNRAGEFMQARGR